MWYLPGTDRLRRIFLNPKEDALMTWWGDERKVDDDKIAHPADCSQWQRFDEKHKEFSDDLRNVRFGLSTDGMNPFNERMSYHNIWPVILTMYTHTQLMQPYIDEHLAIIMVERNSRSDDWVIK